MVSKGKWSSRQMWVTSLALLLLLTSLGLGGHTAQAASVTITNGTDWKDTAGNPIQANSGNILKVGSTYYWYGEHATNGTFDKVNVYTSTDLKNWTFGNSILTKSSAAELNSSKIERPKVIYNAATKKYVLWAHYENGSDYSLARVAVATSDTPDGNFVYQGRWDVVSRIRQTYIVNKSTCK